MYTWHIWVEKHIWWQRKSNWVNKCNRKIQEHCIIVMQLKCCSYAAYLHLCYSFSVSQLVLCASGVLSSGGGGDDGGESSGRAAADPAVHHEQVSLCGDVQRTTLSPVHCRDHGKPLLKCASFLCNQNKWWVDFSKYVHAYLSSSLCAGGICFLSSLSAPTNDRDPLPPSSEQLPQQGGAEGGKLWAQQDYRIFCCGLLSTYRDSINIVNIFMQEFLLKIFCVFRNLMKLTIFPRDWSVMRLLTSQWV